MPILSGSSCIMPVNKCQPKEQNGQKCTFWLMYIKPWMLYILNNGFSLFCVYFSWCSLLASFLPQGYAKVLSSRRKEWDWQSTEPADTSVQAQGNGLILPNSVGNSGYKQPLFHLSRIPALWIESQPFKEHRFRYFNTSHSCHLFFLYLSIWRLRDPPCPSKTICI